MTNSQIEFVFDLTGSAADLAATQLPSVAERADRRKSSGSRPGVVTLLGKETPKLARYAQAATPAAFRQVAKASARKSR